MSKRDESDVSFDCSPKGKRSARTSAVHVSLSSDSIVKQQYSEREAHTLWRSNWLPRSVDRVARGLRSSERRPAAAARSSPAVDGPYIGPHEADCQHGFSKNLQHGVSKNGDCRKHRRIAGLLRFSCDSVPAHRLCPSAPARALAGTNCI